MSNELGRYRKLYARLWRRPGFVSLTEGERILVFYLLSGPQTNRIGLYVLSCATAAEDLGTTPETLKKRLTNVCQTFGWWFDSAARVFFIPSWFKWNPPENVNVMKGSLKDLNEIPPCGLVEKFARNVETLPETLHETFLKGLRQRLPQRSRNQDPDPDLKQEQEPRAFRGDGFTKGLNFDDQVVDTARQILRDAPNQTLEYHIDALIVSCPMHGRQMTRKQAIAVLSQVQAVA